MPALGDVPVSKRARQERRTARREPVALVRCDKCGLVQPNRNAIPYAGCSRCGYAYGISAE